MQDAKLIYISNVIDIEHWGLWCSQPCQSRRTHSCGSSTWWPTWKTCLAWKSKELHAIVKSLWQAIIRNNPNLLSNGDSHPWQRLTAHFTADSELAKKFSWEMLDHPTYILDLAVNWLISTWHFFFILQWRRHTSYHHVADTTGTNTTCVQDGFNHTLWQVPQPWRRLCRKIMYQSHLHCIVLVSSLI
jgi:hypothetical protein